VARYLVVATGGAGGDLQPLMAAAMALRERGHEISFVGDRSVQSAIGDLVADLSVLPAELDLGPRLAGAVREAMTATGGDLATAGPIVQQRLAEWAEETAQPVALTIERESPTLSSPRYSVWRSSIGQDRRALGPSSTAPPTSARIRPGPWSGTSGPARSLCCPGTHRCWNRPIWSDLVLASDEMRTTAASHSSRLRASDPPRDGGWPPRVAPLI
jgi:hypothetical protein